MLKTKITVDDSQVTQALNRVRGAVGKFSGDVKGMIAGAFGGAALVAAISRTIQQIDQIQDASEEFHMPVEQVQALKQAANEGLDSFEELYGIMRKIQDIQFDALKGNNPKAAAIFQKYGIDHDRLNNMTNTADVAKAIAGMSDADVNTLLGLKAGKFQKFKGSLSGLDDIVARGRADGTIRSAEEMNKVMTDTANVKREIDEMATPIIYDLLRIGNALLKFATIVKNVANWLFQIRWPDNMQEAKDGNNYMFKLFGINLLGWVGKLWGKPKGAPSVPTIGSGPLVTDQDMVGGKGPYSDSLTSVGNFLGQAQGSMSTAQAIVDNTKQMVEQQKITNNLLQGQSLFNSSTPWISSGFVL